MVHLLNKDLSNTCNLQKIFLILNFIYKTILFLVQYGFKEFIIVIRYNDNIILKNKYAFNVDSYKSE